MAMAMAVTIVIVMVMVNVMVQNRGLGRGGAEPSAVEVTLEDQTRINRFGKLNNRLEDVKVELKAAKV